MCPERVLSVGTMQLPPDEVSQCPGVCAELPHADCLQSQPGDHSDPLLSLAKTRVRHTGDCSHKPSTIFKLNSNFFILGPGGNFLDCNGQLCSRGPSGRRPPSFKHRGRYKQEAGAEVREEDNTDTHMDTVGSKVDTSGTPVQAEDQRRKSLLSVTSLKRKRCECCCCCCVIL